MSSRFDCTKPYEGPYKKVRFLAVHCHEEELYGDYSDEFDLGRSETAFFPEDYEVPFHHKVLETGVGKLRGCECGFICFGSLVSKSGP